ncbi:MAG: hypothetical protein ACPIOQ_18650 [Promethearchaeia archaeon]|jgi:hypothetical protein
MIIFPGDASFGYVEQAKENKTNNRVYALKFTSTPKKVHFFWMQEPESKRDKDKELADKVNALINGETPAASGGGMGQMDQAQLMAMLTRAHASPASGDALPSADGTQSESPGAAPAAADAPGAAAAGSGQAQTAAGTEASAAPAEGDTEEAAAPDDVNMQVDDEAKKP